MSLYIVDPTGVPTGSATGIKPVPLDDVQDLADTMDRRMSLELLAEATGGMAFGTHSNDYAAAFDRIVEENSSYYLLGYTPTNTQQDGKFRKIRVEVTRPGGATSVGRFAGMKVLARSGYATERSSAARSAAPDVSRLDLDALVKNPISVAGLTLNVSAAPFRREGSAAWIAVTVEARASDLLLANRDTRFDGSMEIAIVAVDADGKTQGGERGSLKMNLSQATRDIVAARGVRLLSAIDVPPGEYHLSVAAVDGGGGAARGSVKYDVTVPDFSKPLSMSGIALSSIETNAIPTSPSDSRLEQSLGLIPTTTRSFRTEDELRVYAEIYDNDGQAHGTTVTTAVRSVSGGSTVFTVQHVLPRATDRTTYPVVTPIPLIDIQPGEYVLTVDVQSSATPDRTISRQVLFSVRPE